ncbi:MAG: endonuclease domain-containing protein [Actinobacteria bacterium]|nr:endonuclease domain-containing protein [Actinomycetota bacterium]
MKEPVPRTSRQEVALRLVRPYGGICTRAMLVDTGIGQGAIDAEIRARRWLRIGRHTVAIPEAMAPSWPSDASSWPRARPGAAGTPELSQLPLLWWAVWESGTGAVLDGASSLTASGLTGYTQDRIDVSVEAGSRTIRHPGIRIKERRPLGPLAPGGIPRVETALSTIRAAQLAVSDRQAALVICMSVQQRIVEPDRLLRRWRGIARSKRRSLIGPVIGDVCDGAHSLGELDFAALCRARDLPEPVRQQLRQGPNGRIYLDVAFACGLVVEIDGAGHSWGLAPVDDALRANHVTLQNRSVLRIPVIGLRVMPQAFMDQVATGIRLRAPH